MANFDHVYTFLVVYSGELFTENYEKAFMKIKCTVDFLVKSHLFI